MWFGGCIQAAVHMVLIFPMGAGHLGIFTDTFSSICGTFFWEYQIGSLIWVIGHLAKVCHTDKRSKCLKAKLNT